MSLPEFNEETILALANGKSYSKGLGTPRGNPDPGVRRRNLPGPSTRLPPI